MSLGLIADYGGVSSDEEVDDTSSSHNTTKNLAPGVRKEAAKPQAHGDDVLEDFVRKTNYGSDVPEKPPGKPPVSELAKHMRLPSAKGKIQISIPSLQDSDSDDESPKIKKPKPSSGASGFLGSLPQPRASGGGGKEAGRAFIPYTLTKHKPSTTNKPKPKDKPVTKLAEAYSDSDEEMQTNNTLESGAGNFFSLDSEPIKPAPMSMGVVNSTPSLSSDSNNYAQAGVASHYSGLETEPTQPRLTAASLYNMSEDVDYSAYQAPDTEEWSAEPSSSTDEVHNMLQSEEFMRLQGKKQRGKEHINLIDVHTDDQKISEIELTKNLSEEVDPAMFAHRKKGEGPSGQQKRKHQITYLAFQAKERELELKNTWAANKATKMQTQAKYGF